MIIINGRIRLEGTGFVEWEAKTFAQPELNYIADG